jgi:hypothetical protein
MLKELLRSLQLSRKKREGGLNWPGLQQLPVHTPQITMEIYISDWIHKFQNKTGLDAKANLELYKSKRVCSVRIVHLILLNAICKSMSTFGTKFKLETEFQDWLDIILVEFQPKFIQRHL